MSTHHETSIRVSTQRLDSVVNLIGELVIAHSMIAQDPEVRSGRLARLSENVAHTDKILHELQDLAMSLRLVPLRPTFQKMSRLVRDLAHRSGRSVRLVCIGEDTEIDRSMVQQLGDPLVHMIRNAVDHGIEPPDERRATGKAEAGTITLRAHHAAGQVVIELSDDGRGLDRGAILARGVEQGLLDPASPPPDRELLAMILRPGFSTADAVTEVSGRGVGMDVVKQTVEALRGRIEASSQPREGTAFTLRLPLTTAIMDAMLLQVGDQRFLLPTIAIVQSFRPARGSVTSMAGKGEVALVRDEVLRVVKLAEILEVDGGTLDACEGLLVLVEADGRRCALLVDGLLGQQQVVVKPLDPAFASLPGVAGGAILGDGRVALILDPPGLVALADGGPPEDAADAPAATGASGEHRVVTRATTGPDGPGAEDGAAPWLEQ